MNEKVIQFGPQRELVGVFSQPENTAAVGSSVDSAQKAPTALILSAGIVHRSGPFRLHVDLARSLAEQGYASLRMDLSGLGDSAVRTDLQDIDGRASLDARDAMDHLQVEYGSDRFVVIGLCSGAYNGHVVAVDDHRVVGGVFLDGLVYRTSGFVRRKYTRRLTSFRFWRNAIKRRMIEGAMDLSADQGPGAEEFFEPNQTADEAAREIQQMLDRNAQLLYLYTEGYEDISSQSQFKEMFDLEPDDEQLQVDYYENFEHTYRLSQHRRVAVQRVCRWYAERFPKKLAATDHCELV